MNIYSSKYQAGTKLTSHTRALSGEKKIDADSENNCTLSLGGHSNAIF